MGAWPYLMPRNSKVLDVLGARWPMMRPLVEGTCGASKSWAWPLPKIANQLSEPKVKLFLKAATIIVSIMEGQLRSSRERKPDVESGGGNGHSPGSRIDCSSVSSFD